MTKQDLMRIIKEELGASNELSEMEKYVQQIKDPTNPMFIKMNNIQKLCAFCFRMGAQAQSNPEVKQQVQQLLKSLA